MALIVKTIGILILAAGVIYLVRPELIRTVIDYAKVGKRCYIFGAVRVVIGLFLLIAIPHVALPWVVGVIGALILIKGVLVFALGLPRVHLLLDRFYGMPDNKLRALVAIAVIVGVLIIYAA